MPIPAVISDLSPIIGTGPSPNGGQPGGGENPSTFDDYLRAYGAFIAQLRAGSGFANSGAFRIPFFDASGNWSSSADFVRDASGNVGIGTSPTGARLTVSGNINTSAGVRIGSLAQTDVATVAGVSVANYGATFGALFTGMASGGTALSGYDGLLFVTFGAERMRIDASGNVGIGITPGAWQGNNRVIELGASSLASYDAATNLQLTLSRNARLDGSFVWRYKNTDTSGASLYLQEGGGHVWSTAPSGTAGAAITFTERTRIDASGNLLVGTTTTNLAAGGLFLVPGALSELGIGHGSSAPAASTFVTFRFNNTAIGGVTQSGTTGVNFNTTSDARLKTNVQPADDAGALLDAVQVRQFNWVSDGAHQRYGFIAQELFEVVPEAVHVPADPEAMMAVDYSKLVPLLVREIQALRARVAALEAA
jgi:hypothetical protein